MREQALSKHYISCLAKGHEDDLRIDEQMARDGHLFLWIVGQRMSLNGEGFQARAKVRTLTDEHGQVRGLYVEKVYGMYTDLWNSRDELETWTASYFGYMVPIMTLAKKGEGVELWCPSAAAGHSDTQAFRLGKVGPHWFEVYSFEREVQKLLDQGYSLDQLTFNPQNGKLKVKK